MGRDLKPQASEKTLKFSESEVFIPSSEDMNLMSNSKLNKRVNSTNRKQSTAKISEQNLDTIQSIIQKLDETCSKSIFEQERPE